MSDIVESVSPQFSRLAVEDAEPRRLVIRNEDRNQREQELESPQRQLPIAEGDNFVGIDGLSGANAAAAAAANVPDDGDGAGVALPVLAMAGVDAAVANAANDGANDNDGAGDDPAALVFAALQAGMEGERWTIPPHGVNNYYGQTKYNTTGVMRRIVTKYVTNYQQEERQHDLARILRIIFMLASLNDQVNTGVSFGTDGRHLIVQNTRTLMGLIIMYCPNLPASQRDCTGLFNSIGFVKVDSEGNPNGRFTNHRDGETQYTIMHNNNSVFASGNGVYINKMRTFMFNTSTVHAKQAYNQIVLMNAMMVMNPGVQAGPGQRPEWFIARDVHGVTPDTLNTIEGYTYTENGTLPNGAGRYSPTGMYRHQIMGEGSVPEYPPAGWQGVPEYPPAAPPAGDGRGAAAASTRRRRSVGGGRTGRTGRGGRGRGGGRGGDPAPLAPVVMEGLRQEIEQLRQENERLCQQIRELGGNQEFEVAHLPPLPEPGSPPAVLPQQQLPALPEPVDGENNDLNFMLDNENDIYAALADDDDDVVGV